MQLQTTKLSTSQQYNTKCNIIYSISGHFQPSKSSIKFVENFHRRFDEFLMHARPFSLYNYIMGTKHTLPVIVSSVSSLSKAKLSFNNPSVRQKSELKMATFAFRKLCQNSHSS